MYCRYTVLVIHSIINDIIILRNIIFFFLVNIVLKVLYKCTIRVDILDCVFASYGRAALASQGKQYEFLKCEDERRAHRDSHGNNNNVYTKKENVYLFFVSSLDIRNSLIVSSSCKLILEPFGCRLTY